MEGFVNTVIIITMVFLVYFIITFLFYKGVKPIQSIVGLIFILAYTITIHTVGDTNYIFFTIYNLTIALLFISIKADELVIKNTLIVVYFILLQIILFTY